MASPSRRRLLNYTSKLSCFGQSRRRSAPAARARALDSAGGRGQGRRPRGASFLYLWFKIQGAQTPSCRFNGRTAARSSRCDIPGLAPCTRTGLVSARSPDPQACGSGRAESWDRGAVLGGAGPAAHGSRGTARALPALE